MCERRFSAKKAYTCPDLPHGSLGAKTDRTKMPKVTRSPRGMFPARRDTCLPGRGRKHVGSLHLSVSAGALSLAAKSRTSNLTSASARDFLLSAMAALEALAEEEQGIISVRLDRWIMLRGATTSGFAFHPRATFGPARLGVTRATLPLERFLSCRRVMSDRSS